MSPAGPDDNGLLSAVPGQFIAEGSKSLGAPGLHQGAELAAVVDTGTLWHGKVRIRYASSKMKRGKHAHWAWVAVHAEKV